MGTSVMMTPWPKKQHHKRRFIVKQNLARVMKDGAQLCFASDHMDFVFWSLQRLLAHPSFRWDAQSANDWRNPPQDLAPTRYERKALKRGQRPAYLLFTRLPRDQ